MQEEYSKEFEEKKSELQTKVIEIYEASSTEIKVPHSFYPPHLLIIWTFDNMELF